MTRIAIPAIIVMLAVAGLLGTAGWNASGEPRQVIVLTERELALPYRNPATGDDPGLQLLLQYTGRFDALESRNWLPESRLRELGFPIDVPIGSPQAAVAYDHVPPRVAWVVFEYDGPAWREIERRRELQPEHLRVASGRGSRLVPVDAGLDHARLAARYPTGHVILRAVIALNYVTVESGGPMIHGTLRELVPSRVAVPAAFKPLLDSVSNTPTVPDGGPRYEAEIAIGRLGLPYVRAVRLLGS